MLLIVSDASVLIDIECGNLTAQIFELPWKFIVPDVLFYEELADHHGHLLACGLIIKSFDSHAIEEVQKLRQKYAKVSFNDLLSLTLAKHEKCSLLTGDKALRNLSEKLNVEVRGTIWLVNQLIQFSIISHETALTAFNSMKNSGSRLPWDEIKKIIEIEEVLHEN